MKQDQTPVAMAGEAACPVCGEAGFRRLMDQQKDRAFLLLECRRCGLIRLAHLREPREAPQDTPPAVSTQTLDTFSSFLQGLNARLIIKPEVRRVKRYVTERGPVLDVGCGTGWAASKWQTYSGMEVHGIETVKERAEMASTRYGLHVLKGRFEDLRIPDKAYALVIFRHVLEHFKNPVQVLETAYRVLRPGGHVLVIVPNGAGLGRRIFRRYWIWGSPEHIHTFSPESLGYLLEKIGFESRWVVHSPSPVLLSGSLGNWLKCRGKTFLAKYIHQGSLPINALFFPLALTGKLFQRGEVITILARKRSEDH